MTSSQGRTLSKTVSSPPTIKVRVPLIAPGVEPVQGAPRKSIPALASSSWVRRLEAGLTVLASTTISPGFPPSFTPEGPRITASDIAESPTQRKTHSACRATSAGVVHALPPASAASFPALPPECDQSATSCPALRRFRAMEAPIRPSPRNPSFAIKEDCILIRRNYERRDVVSAVFGGQTCPVRRPH